MVDRGGPTRALSLLLLAAAAVAVSAQSTEYPPLDGVGNNKANPTWGAAGTPYIRQQVPQDAFGPTGSAMTGSNRPSARAVSLALTNSPYFKAASRYNTSYLLSALGQLVSGDINRLESDAGSNGGAAPIPIPPGDPLFAQFKDGAALEGSRPALNFMRSAYVMGPGPNASRQALNKATSFIDASGLYGEDENTSQAIRAGTAGLLLDDGQRLLPFNRDKDTGRPILPMKNAAGRVPATQLRLSGNGNVNQNPLPLTLTTLMLREHNRRALQLAQEHPDWGDEQVFQGARKWVVAHMQRITLVDYLTGLGILLQPYLGYNATLNPTTDTFFSTVAYRYGHSTIADVILRLGPDWQEHPKGHLSMAASYYNPNVVLMAGLEPLLRGLIAMPQGEIESRWAWQAAVPHHLLQRSHLVADDAGCAAFASEGH
ncbi:peroxidase [Scenedesmus sp. NREL 46B-D3]|nr:peroxidase [Scenedesmus sp. NREL 46B-D3]